MIIKLELNGRQVVSEPTRVCDTHESAVVSGERPPWRILDGVHDIEVHDLEQGSVPPADGYNKFYLVAKRDEVHDISDNRVWIEARQRVSDDKELEICIVSDLCVYLLNDNGKTIERLN